MDVQTLIARYQSTQQKVKKLPKWILHTDEGGDKKSFNILLQTQNDLRFQYKYHNVLDLSKSKLYVKDDSDKYFAIDYLINIFVDFMNGGFSEFNLDAEMHDLISLNIDSNSQPNCYIQIFDRNNNMCFFSQKTIGKIAAIENN